MRKTEEATYIKSLMGYHVELLKSSRHGKGLFARTDIAKDTFIHVTHVHRDLIEYAGCENTWINLIPNHRYNHSEKHNNCKIVTEGLTKGLITISDVREGQELLVDYSEDKSLEQPEGFWHP